MANGDLNSINFTLGELVSSVDTLKEEVKTMHDDIEGLVHFRIKIMAYGGIAGAVCGTVFSAFVWKILPLLFV